MSVSPPQDRTFKAGEYLFHEGDTPKAIYLIKTGVVAIRKRSPSGGFMELAKIHSKEVLGEVAFFDRLPRSASALAQTEVVANEITFAALDKIYDTIPGYMKTIMNSICDRLRRANETIRRLQKESDRNAADEPPKEIEPDAASVLAATEDPNKKS